MKGYPAPPPASLARPRAPLAPAAGLPAGCRPQTPGAAGTSLKGPTITLRRLAPGPGIGLPRPFRARSWLPQQPRTRAETQGLKGTDSHDPLVPCSGLINCIEGL